MFRYIERMREQNLVFVAYSVLFILDIVGISADCPERQFKNRERCVNCPSYCIFCNSTEFCFSCDNGYSGTTCQHFCDNCKPGTRCVKGNGICMEDCRDGLSGPYCNKTCDSICNTCYRNDTAKCLTYRNNPTSDPVCPEDCLLQECKGNHCTNGCLPGYWGEACEHRCPDHCSIGRRVTDTHNTDIYMIAVPVLSAVLFIVVGGCLVILCWKRRKSRCRNSQVVVYRHQDTTERLSENQADSENISWYFDDEFYDNYDHLADDDIKVVKSEAKVPDKKCSYAYAMPYARFQSRNGKVDVKQLDKSLP